MIKAHFFWIAGVTITAIFAISGIGLNMVIPESQFWGTVLLVVAGLLTVGLIILAIIVWRQTDSLEEDNAWNISGARLPRFKLYEAACLLHCLDPVWPLTNQKSKEEYQSLVIAAKEFRLRIVITDGGVRTIGEDEKGQQTFHMAWKEADDGPEALRDIEVDRKALREYLESESRTVPEFLNERFDAEAARNHAFFS